MDWWKVAFAPKIKDYVQSSDNALHLTCLCCAACVAYAIIGQMMCWKDHMP